ncbi:FlgD immunoglobulin-like domain containing protein [Angustibacter luteus]|uniref:FlgD immunoglobulin-like domain containing protein n=1 Tax=Angustibacter luteus TaxID=658456 RepID=A0ABW1JBW5_9ACTN
MRRPVVTFAALAAVVVGAIVPLAARPAAALPADGSPGYAAPDPTVTDPAGTVRVPRVAQLSPAGRSVLGAYAGTRALLQPDLDGECRLWWQTDDAAPVPSELALGPGTCLVQGNAISVSGPHVLARLVGTTTVRTYSIHLDTRTVTQVAISDLVTATPDGWVKLVRSPTPVLQRVVEGGATSTLTLDFTLTNAQTSGNPFGRAAVAAADSDGMVLVAFASDPAQTGVRYIPFDGGPTTLLATTRGVPFGFSLAGADAAWQTAAVAATDTAPALLPTIHRVRRTGGDDRTLALPNTFEQIDQTAITPDATYWIGRTSVVVIPGDGSNRVAYRAGADLSGATKLSGMNATSMAAEGDHVVMVDELPIADAGLYRVSAVGEPTVLAATTSPAQPVRGFAFDGRHLVDDRVPNERQTFRSETTSRTVSSAGTLGQPVQVQGQYPTESFAVAVDAGRAVLASTSATDDVDLTHPSGSQSWVNGSGPALAEVSADTAVVQGRLTTPDHPSGGTTLPGAVTWAVFDRTVVWSTSRGQVWRQTGGAAAQEVLSAACAADCPALVGIWGDVLVVQPLVGSLQVRRTSDSGLVRTLPAIPAADTANPPALTLEDGVLAWVEQTAGRNGVLRVMDLTVADPQPTDVARARRDPGVRAVQLRGGRLAWVSAQDRGLRLAASPITRAPAVGLLGLTAGTVLSPNGDGAFDTWSVHATGTQPLDAVTLTIRAGDGTAVRTVTTSAADARIDLDWDGTTDAGQPAAEGAYRWQLTGRSNGGTTTPAATGTVVLRRTAPAVVLSVPEVSTTVSSSALVPISWRPTTPQPSWSPPARYEVDVQPWGDASPAVRWDLGCELLVTTSTHLTFNPNRCNGVGARVWRFRARAVVAGEVAGAWSPWSTMTIPFDDSTRYQVQYDGQAGAWVAQHVSGAFMGTQHRSGRPDGVAWSKPWQKSNRVRVLVTTCPQCGKVRIRVDRGPWLTVDTYSRSVRRRVSVYQSTRSLAVHLVEVQNLATRGRPYLYLDAIAFQVR